MRLPGSLRFRASARDLVRHPWHLVLTVAGVAVGVAAVVALDLAIQSSREAFRVSGETVTGRATHQITGGATGLPDSVPALLTVEGGLRAVAPVVEGWGTDPRFPGRVLRVLGVDPFSEAPFRSFLSGIPAQVGGGLPGTRLLTRPGAAVLSAETAEALGVEEGDSFTLRVDARAHRLVVAGILEALDRWSREGLRDLLVVDVAEAQLLLGREGRLDRVDLLIPTGEEASLLARVASLLPPGATVAEAGARTQAMEEMIRAFDLNLTALSLLGLVFGLFLVYNTVTFSVVRRRPLYGTLRALGATRGEVLRGVLGEAALLGAAGAVLGVLLGILLGRGLVGLVTRTINDLYFVVSVEGLALPPEVLLRGAALGVGAALLAAVAPAWEATTVPPGEALARSAAEHRARRRVVGAAAGGVGLLGLGLLLLSLTSRSVEAAFGGLFAVVLGLALVVPLATMVLMAVLRPVLRRGVGIVGGMAARGVVTSLSRTAPAMAALVVAVAVTVGLGVMIHSFRGSVVRWLDATLQADLYVSPPSVISSRAQGRLPSAVAEAAMAHPRVDGVSTYLGTEFFSSYGRTRLVALDLHPRGRDAFVFLAQDGDGVLERFRGGEGALLSEPFAFRHGLGVGDTVRLPGERGEAVLPVLAVFRDYGSDLGTVIVGRAAYDRFWSDPGVTSLGIFLAEEEDGEGVAAALRAAAGEDSPLAVRRNRELRDRSLEVFDRTFEVTRVLRALAFLVAFIAVLSALMALQLERTRELGVLRANGMTPGQGWGLVTIQTTIMGAAAGVLAIPVGLTLAAIMVHVVNRRSFGWTVELEATPELAGQAVLLAVAGALLAGIYPAWRLARTSPAEALRGE